MKAGLGGANDAASIFPGGGTAGAVLRATDWSSTALGPVGGWPSALKALVRAMLSTHQATSLFWGPDLVNLYNDGFIALLGEKHPAAMGQRAQQVWSDAWPVVGELLDGVITSGRAVLFQEMLVPIVRKGRLEDAWWNYSYSPAFDDDGAIAGILVVATETTAEVAGRKQLEAATLEAELARQDLHSLFMQAPLPMALLKGPEHRFVLVNEPYRALVGRDVLGKALREAFTEEETGHYLPILDGIYRTGEPRHLEEAPLRLPDAAGIVSDRFIDVGYTAYRGADGAVAGVIAVIHDVTAKVTARMRESAFRKTAETANRAKDEFLATVSHELRTPLNAILGWSRILKAHRDPARVDKGLAVIERNATAQAKLIEEILDVSRIISGKFVIQLRRIELAGVIRNAVDSVRPAAAAKGIHLELTLDEANIEFVADEDRLQQIVWNLVSNAVKFTPAGGEIRVTVARESSRVTLRVEDTGIGISADLLPYVFDRFRQDDASTTRRHGGLGLGLAIVRHLVELHGGTVEARSEGAGKGAILQVVLPIRAVEPRERAAPPPRVDTALPERPEGGLDSLEGLHVLVVDDEDDARDLVATVLREAGASVTEASSAAAAMHVLASTSIAVLVSDLGMPTEDGYTLIKRLRSDGPPASRNVPALALTAYARPEDRKRVLAAGFQDHAAKPVDPDALVRRVAALVGR